MVASSSLPCPEPGAEPRPRTVGTAASPGRFQAGEGADQDPDAEVVVTRLDFWDALADLRPSLSAAELARYRQLREGYEGRDRRR